MDYGTSIRGLSLIAHELNKLEREVVTLEDEINKLSESLKPILREKLINAKEGSVKDESEPETLLGKNVRVITNRIEKMSNFVEEIIERMEI